MRHGAVLLNFSREEVVEADAVARALWRRRRLRATCAISRARACTAIPAVVALPHLGASTREAEDNCAVMVAQQVRDYPGARQHPQRGELSRRRDGARVALPLGIANANVPNMLGQISTTMANAGLNIHNMLNKSKGEMAYTLVDVDSPVVAGCGATSWPGSRACCRCVIFLRDGGSGERRPGRAAQTHRRARRPHPAACQRARGARPPDRRAEGRWLRCIGPSAKRRCCAGCTKRTPARCRPRRWSGCSPRSFRLAVRWRTRCRVAFLGPRGTFSEEAAHKRFGGSVRAVACASIDEVFRQVEARQVGFGVVPVENSTDGAVGPHAGPAGRHDARMCGEVCCPCTSAS